MFKLKRSLVVMLHIYLSFRFIKSEDIDQCNSSCNNNNSNVSQSTCSCSQCHLYADCCRDMAHIKQQQASFECNIKTSVNQMTFSLTRCPSWWSLEPRYLREFQFSVKRQISRTRICSVPDVI